MAASFARVLGWLRRPRSLEALRRDAARLTEAGRREEALAALRELARHPAADKNDWLRLGLCYRDLGDTCEAAESFARAVALAPDSPAALANAAAAQRDIGCIEESLALFRRARQLVPDNLAIFSAYLFALNLSTRCSREEIFREHCEFGRRMEARSVAAPPPRRAADGVLRIGYLSPDLRRHAVSLFVEPLLRHHDRGQFRATCYYVHPDHDERTEVLRGLSDGWVDCAQWPAEQMARRIASDGIDILVDLAGHTGGSRLDVVALKPAPVIAGWLGYLNTSGLRCVDFRITDRHTDPPGQTECFHTERLMRLPESQWCRARIEAPTAVTPLPAAQRGALTFGSFNNAGKLTIDVLSLWARLLAALTDARLLFASVQGARADDIRQVFSRDGVDPARLSFAPRASLHRFHELHHGVDIALDAHPYSGATTTIESLWMGVPTLTLTSEAPISRSSASILTTLGMDDWIARTPEEFIAAARRFGSDREALALLRRELRPRLEKSTLMDGARFVPRVESLYRDMWRA
jgi:predicted O-linked N-acetylglucosamine transferase (SPINDLY family)